MKSSNPQPNHSSVDPPTAAASLQAQYVDAGGIRTAYYRAGKGRPVILVHGGGAGADGFGNWSACIDELAPHFDAIAVDMVGFGHSAKPPPSDFAYDQQSRVKHLGDFINALGVGPVYLVGNSMGGLTSLELSVARPELVTAMILMGSAGVRTPMTEALLTLTNYDFTLEWMSKIVKELTNQNFAVSPEMVAYRHKLSIDAKTRAAHAALQEWIASRRGLYCDDAVLTQISVPTLVVSGKNDKVVPVTSAYRMLELIPHSWGQIYPDCGHWAMIEHPVAFCRSVIHFFEDFKA